MSNNCIIKPLNGSVGIYLHWNGGIDSVTAFLKYAEIKGHRAFGGDKADGYGIARLAQIIGNFFGGNLSIGITLIDENNTGYNYDNGIYVIDGWDIVERRTDRDFKDEFTEGYDITEFLIDIDNCQPEGERLGEEFIRAEELLIKDVKIGDIVFFKMLDDSFIKTPVVGIHNGDPYVNIIGDKNNEDAWKNGNNYLYNNARLYSTNDEYIRVVK